jgi:hypothetical protein
MAFPNVSIVSKNQVFTMGTKVSIDPLDIHTSKLIVQVLHQSIVENTNLSLVFYVILGQISFINCCVEVNFSLKFCLKISLPTNGASKK